MSNVQLAKNDLNNVLQRDGKKAEYEYTSSGPSSNLTWTAIVTIDGTEYGRGSASSKTNAGHIAAKNALDEYMSKKGA